MTENHMDARRWTRVAVNEHEFAQFLRAHGAIDNHTSQGDANYWHGPDGRTVAIATYAGSGGMTVTYYIRADLSL